MKVEIKWFPNGAKKAVKEKKKLVIIDALRCSSFIVTALAIGAREIYPVRSVAEALRLKKRLLSRGVKPILAGEIGATKIKSFDIGNSPSELMKRREEVIDNPIILKTTAGTRVILSAIEAELILVGSFLNAKALADYISLNSISDLALVCCGFKAESFSLEDFLCAGAIISNLPKDYQREEESFIAEYCFKNLSSKLEEVVSISKSAKRLKELNYMQDVKFCTQLNKFDIVPILKEKRFIKAEERSFKIS